MRVSNEAQTPIRPVRERPTPQAEEARERVVKPREKTPEPPPRPEGPVGRNLDTQA